jgi:hypothetical protein
MTRINTIASYSFLWVTSLFRSSGNSRQTPSTLCSELIPGIVHFGMPVRYFRLERGGPFIVISSPPQIKSVTTIQWRYRLPRATCSAFRIQNYINSHICISFKENMTSPVDWHPCDSLVYRTVVLKGSSILSNDCIRLPHIRMEPQRCIPPHHSCF